MAKQGTTHSLELDAQPSSSSATSSATSSDLSLSHKPRIMKLDLITLPQFNVTYISRCLTVSERLTIMTCIHPRFHQFLLQPQCFPDMSFFPVSDDASMYAPKILSSNGCCGITYVEINILSKHPFISRVALLAGMWNFKADLWNRIDWPLNVNIESLQLTLDYTSTVASVHLDHPPRLDLHLDAATAANQPQPQPQPQTEPVQVQQAVAQEIHNDNANSYAISNASDQDDKSRLIQQHHHLKIMRIMK